MYGFQSISIPIPISKDPSRNRGFKTFLCLFIDQPTYVDSGRGRHSVLAIVVRKKQLIGRSGRGISIEDQLGSLSRRSGGRLALRVEGAKV